MANFFRLVLLTGFAIIYNEIAQSYGRNFVFPTNGNSNNDVSYSEDQKHCFNERKVLWKNDGICYKLLTQGPCSNVEWLVLDKERAKRRRIEPVCKRCVCCDEGSPSVFWPNDKKCHAKQEKLCSPGNVLGNDPYGDGRCMCITDPPHAKWKSNDTCYRLYWKGPCSPGSVFIHDSHTNSKRCVQNPCGKQGQARWEDDGRCYDLGEQGPCTNDSKFNVHPLSFIPTCLSKTNNLITVPPNCRVDPAGQCREPFNISRSETSYLEELLNMRPQ